MEYEVVRNIPAIIQVRNVLEARSGLAYATGTIQIEAGFNAVDGDIINISDGVIDTDYTFVDALTGAADEVLIGSDNAETAYNFYVAVLANSPDTEDVNGVVITDRARGIDVVILDDITTSVSSDSGDTGTIYLRNTIPGDAGNVDIELTVDDSADWTVVGMSGGREGYDTIAPTLTNDCDVTDTPKTIADLLGDDILATTRKVTVWPHATGIFVGPIGVGIADGAPLGTDKMTVVGNAETLTDMYFVSAGSVACTIVEEG